MQSLKLLYSLILLFISPTVLADPNCIDWFNQSKVQKTAKDCVLKCSTIKVDMGTFTCPNQCDILCGIKSEDSVLAKFVLYPGLTPAEKNLIVEKPKDALTVYKQKNIAEKSTVRNFPDQNLNDESDAFRHFLWAALLTKELSASKAKEFLDAHEADPDQPDIERQMDEYNNSRGQAAAEGLIKEKHWSLKNIEARGLEELRSKHLQVLKPGLPIPEETK